MSKCANEGCENTYTPKTHNMKYCSAECCRVATNRRIMEKYYAKRDQRAGKARFCIKCKATRLSRYNDSQVCGSCRIASTSSANNAVVNMLAAVSWQA